MDISSFCFSLFRWLITIELKSNLHHVYGINFCCSTIAYLTNYDLLFNKRGIKHTAPLIVAAKHLIVPLNTSHEYSHMPRLSIPLDLFSSSWLASNGCTKGFWRRRIILQSHSMALHWYCDGHRNRTTTNRHDRLPVFVSELLYVQLPSKLWMPFFLNGAS